MIEFLFDLFVEVFVELLFEGFIGEILLGNEGKPKLPLTVRMLILSVLCLVPSTLCLWAGIRNAGNTALLIAMLFIAAVFIALYIAGLARMLKNNRKYR